MHFNQNQVYTVILTNIIFNVESNLIERKTKLHINIDLFRKRKVRQCLTDLKNYTYLW